VTDVSVLLCYKNPGDRLIPTLEHLKNQQTEYSWELIAIDNGSTDQSTAIISNALKNSTFPFQLLEEKYPGKQAALLTGIAAARGALLIICDDDNLLDSNYIQKAVDCASNHPEIGLFGGYGRAPQTEIPAWVEPVKLKYALGPQSNQSGTLPAPQTLWGAGMVIRRRLMVPLIEEKFPFISLEYPVNSLRNGEDFELSLLFHLLGIPMFYCDELQFVHNIHPDRFSEAAHRDLIQRQDQSYHEIFPYYALLDRWNKKPAIIKICSTLEQIISRRSPIADQALIQLQLLISPRGKYRFHPRTQCFQQLKRQFDVL